MRTNSNTKVKLPYYTPFMERVELDSEISLALQSSEEQPPILDNNIAKEPEMYNNDPFSPNGGF